MLRGLIACVLLVVAVGLVAPGWACNNDANLPKDITSLPYYGPASSTTGAPKLEVACGDIPAAAVGHWYRYDVPSTVDQTVYATTCTEYTNFDTVLELYESWSAECILTDPYYMPNCTKQMDGTSYDTDGPCSTLEFVPAAGKTYWIYVFGYVTGSGATSGIYSLIVDKTMPGACAANSTSVPNPSLSTPWTKTNINTATTGVLISPKCGLLADKQKGNWFVYTGDGNIVTITICPNSGYDTRFTVYTPGTCNNCYCAQCGPVYDDNLQSSTGLCESTSFLTVSGKPYFVFVTTALVDATAIYKATFARSLPPPSCSSLATPLYLGTRVLSYLSSSGNGVSNTDCGTTTSAKGVWYSITGYSGEMFLSTCGLETSVNTKISVFTAAPGCVECSCLTCTTASVATDVSLVSDFSQYCVKASRTRSLSITRFPYMNSTETYYVFISSTQSYTYSYDQVSVVLVNDPSLISSAHSFIISSGLSAMILVVFLAILSIIIV